MEQYRQNEQEMRQLRQRLYHLEEWNRVLSQRPEFKDARIHELEEQLAKRVKEQAPQREREERARMEAWSNTKCSGQLQL